MGRVKTFVNGGSLLPGDLNKMEDDYEGSYAFYKTIMNMVDRIDAPAGGTYLLGEGWTGSGEAITSAKAGMSIFNLTPADYEASAVNARTLKYNLKATIATNAVAPAVNFTLGLYPVTAVKGAENAVEVTLGTVTTGSTVVFTAPAKEVTSAANSGEFTAPAAGPLAMAVVVSGAAAAKSSIVVRAQLTFKQV